MNVSNKVENIFVTGSIHKLDNFSLSITTLQCAIDEAASDDRAERCSFSVHYHCNGRRRLVGFQATESNAPCEYTCICMVEYIA